MKISNLLFILIAFTFQFCNQVDLSNPVIAINSPAGDNSAEPYLTQGADGNLYLSWVEKNDATAVLYYSKWEDGAWSVANEIARGDDWFVNWADYPAMAVNKNGDMIAHYLQKSDSGTYTYDVKVVAKKAGNNSWSAPIKLHSDTVNAEHGFVSMQPYDDGRFFLAWLDGRNTTNSNGHEHGNGGAMTIRGAIIDADLNKSNDQELDARTCDCCQTSVVLVNNQPIVMYRDRSEDEIRDMSLVKFDNGQWSTPKIIYPDNWKIAGCPVNGPKIAAKEGTIAIAWFSVSQDTAQVKLVFSNDGGNTINAPIMIDNSGPLGRVDVELLSNTTALVSWLDIENNEAVIKVGMYNQKGLIGAPKQISISKESRSSGFPQMATHNNSVFYAWTDAQDGSKVNVANLAL